MEVDPTVPVVKNMLLLDSEGKRIAVKHYAAEWSASENSSICNCSLCLCKADAANFWQRCSYAAFKCQVE